jgi:hypothetical protein
MGFKREQFSSYTYAIPFRHHSVDANLTFWNDVNQSNDYSAMFVFEDFKTWAALDRELAVIPFDFDVAPASDDELNGQRRIEGIINWTYKDLPYVTELPEAQVQDAFK